jgi:hypothetical protein
MNQIHHGDPRAFSGKKISLVRATILLRRHGIQVGREKAEMILDFLYLIAKSNTLCQL